MSRVAAQLLLLLIASYRLPSNADAIRALDVAKATDAHPPPRPGESDIVGAPSDPDGSNRKSSNEAGDNDEYGALHVSRVSEYSNDDDDDVSKRKWGDVSLQAWGKRRWNALNSNAAWGKRGRFDQDASEQERKWTPEKVVEAWDERRPADKRRWSANSGMQAWGRKRSPWLGVDGRSKRSVSYDEEPRLAFFGDGGQRQALVKRQWRYGGPKRQWEFNRMKTWGKRRPAAYGDYDGFDNRVLPKRSWSSDNSLRIWG